MGIGGRQEKTRKVEKRCTARAVLTSRVTITSTSYRSRPPAGVTRGNRLTVMPVRHGPALLINTRQERGSAAASPEAGTYETTRLGSARLGTAQLGPGAVGLSRLYPTRQNINSVFPLKTQKRH